MALGISAQRSFIMKVVAGHVGVHAVHDEQDVQTMKDAACVCEWVTTGKSF